MPDRERLECAGGCGALHPRARKDDLDYHGWQCDACRMGVTFGPPPAVTLLRLTGWLETKGGLWAHPAIEGHHATSTACRLTIGDLVVLEDI
jgi:hypothetical protein